MSLGAVFEGGRRNLADGFIPTGGESIKSLLKRLDAEDGGVAQDAMSLEDIAAKLHEHQLVAGRAANAEPATTEQTAEPRIDTGASTSPAGLNFRSAFDLANAPPENEQQPILPATSGQQAALPSMSEPPHDSSTRDGSIFEAIGTSNYAASGGLLVAFAVAGSLVYLASTHEGQDVFGTASVFSPQIEENAANDKSVTGSIAEQGSAKGRLGLASGARLLEGDQVPDTSVGSEMPSNKAPAQNTEVISADVGSWTAALTPAERTPQTIDTAKLAPSGTAGVDAPPANNPPAAVQESLNAARAGSDNAVVKSDTELVAAASDALGQWLFEAGPARHRLELKAESVVSSPGGRQIQLPFQIEPAAGIRDVASVVIRGLPANYEVSAASALGDGSWVLVPDALGVSRITIPDVKNQTAMLDVSVFSMEANLLAHKRIKLEVTPGHVSRAVSDGDAAKLVTRGKQLFDSGDVAAARLLFERAADGGNAQAAYALGETFDPTRLMEKGILGLSGNPDKAREWYKRAEQQGVSEASSRLQILSAKPSTNSN